MWFAEMRARELWWTRGAIFVLAAMTASGLARATTVRQNEATVMRLIFDDCLGYVRDDRVPFRDLSTRPASAAAIRDLMSPPLDRVGVVTLFSGRYIADWGAGKGDRFCVIRMRVDDAGNRAPAVLGVYEKGFVARVTARALREGISQRDGDTFDAPSITSWHQPDSGHETGPLRPISFTVMPTARDARTGVAEVGIIVMGGPPLPPLPEKEGARRR